MDFLVAAKAGPIIAATRNPASLAEYAARGGDVRKADFDDEAGPIVALQADLFFLRVSPRALRPGDSGTTMRRRQSNFG